LAVAIWRRVTLLSKSDRYTPFHLQVRESGALDVAEIIRFQFSRHGNYDKLGEPERAAAYFAALG